MFDDPANLEARAGRDVQIDDDNVWLQACQALEHGARDRLPGAAARVEGGDRGSARAGAQGVLDEVQLDPLDAGRRPVALHVVQQIGSVEDAGRDHGRRCGRRRPQGEQFGAGGGVAGVEAQGAGELAAVAEAGAA